MTPWGMVFFGIAWIFTMAPAFAADVGGKPEKSDIVVSYAQPSGAFTPIWVAYEAGLFKNHADQGVLADRQNSRVCSMPLLPNNLLQQLLFADAVDPPTTGESENAHWSERQ